MHFESDRATLRSSGHSAILAAFSFILILSVLAFVFLTLRWPLVGDAPLFHYIVFLINHGYTPYTQIVDLNLPGTYAIEAGAMKLFGPGPLGWRFFDLTSLALVGLGMLAICGWRRRFPALFASSVFALIHGRDGLIQQGQRDLSITVLLLWSCALLIKSEQSSSQKCLIGISLSGLLLGAAITIKPVVVLLLLFWFLLFAFHLRRQNQPCSLPSLCGLIAASVPCCFAAAALYHWHAIRAFAQIMLSLVPLHASMFRLSPAALLLHSISSVMLGVLLCAFPLLIAFRFWRSFSGKLSCPDFCLGLFPSISRGVHIPIIGTRLRPSCSWQPLSAAGRVFARKARPSGLVSQGLHSGRSLLFPNHSWKSAGSRGKTI